MILLLSLRLRLRSGLPPRQANRGLVGDPGLRQCGVGRIFRWPSLTASLAARRSPQAGLPSVAPCGAALSRV